MYEFRDISERSLKLLRQCFIDSKILKPNLLNPDFMTLFPSPGI